MKEPRKLRKNGDTALFHTREDINVIINAHNELCDCVTTLMDKCNKLEQQIREMKSNTITGAERMFK